MTIANYEATVATGLENLAKDEARDKLGVEAVTQQGRIWFSSDLPVSRILNLKTINNVFVILHSVKLPDEEMPQDVEQLEKILMDVGDRCDWATGVQKWQEMSGFSSHIDKILTNSGDNRDEQPKFRVSSNRFGPKHKFTSPEICARFGHVVDTKLGWPIKLKDYDLEIMANFNENHLYVGFTLSAKSLDRRNVVDTGYTTLKAPTCYALLRVAKIQPGDIVIDPMAGSGAIPAECCSLWNEEWSAFTLAGEIKSVPLSKCQTNLKVFEQAPKDLLLLDVTSMPFKTGSIDVFVSDLPFGRRHGSKRANKILYPALLKEMGRLARRKTARAVLLTQDFNSMNIANDRNKNLWFQKMCTFVKIGNLNCYIYLFLRNDTEYKDDKV